ncbi:copper-binding protein [Pendulispora albinea]|uniref:Copper-binding protein n=1 Tax=Pendulispora albinea TaxID=2741071 RepID=A0ABZ2LM18_9BACT
MTTTPSFFRRYLPWAIGIWLLLTGIIVGTVLWLDARPREPAVPSEADRHEATGVIRSFGPDKSYINVAHDRIEGYMEAMTMSFAFRDRAQAAGLEIGDRVRFTFEADRQGRLLIASITKEAPR